MNHVAVRVPAVVFWVVKSHGPQHTLGKRTIRKEKIAELKYLTLLVRLDCPPRTRTLLLKARANDPIRHVSCSSGLALVVGDFGNSSSPSSSSSSTHADEIDRYFLSLSVLPVLLAAIYCHHHPRQIFFSEGTKGAISVHCPSSGS